MLIPQAANASLVVCSTCRFSPERRRDDAGRSAGELLAELLKAALPAHACRGKIDIQTMPCLFACSSHCTIFLRSQGRVGYILGKFEPRQEHGAAILDYAERYLDSADGVVPYARWPQGVKGHFLVRVPPEGFVFQPPIVAGN